MRDDGGPAFPRPMTNLDLNADGAYRQEQDGMTLRDYFAIRFAAAEVQAFGGQLDEDGYASVAAEAYLMADAMLAERAK